MLLNSIEYWQDKHPQKKAVVFQDQFLTYEELINYSKSLACYLLKNQCNATKIIGLYLPPGLELSIALLATWMTGSAYVPLDPSLPNQRICEIAKEVNLSCILAYDFPSNDLSQKISSIPWIKIHEGLYSISHTTSLPVVHLDHLAYIIFTSGSTGKPKGVEITHKNLLNLIYSFANLLNLSSKDKLLSLTSISFDIFGLEAFLPLYCGATTYLAEKFLSLDPSALLEFLLEKEITILQGTPSLFQMLIEEDWPSLSLRHILCGGENWDSKLAISLIQKSPQNCALWNVYGPTETTIWSSAYQVQTPEQIYLSPTINKTVFYVLDEALNFSEEGELYIGGEGVGRGYHDNEQLTQNSFIKNPFGSNPSILYKTGDQVLRIGPNIYQFKGRKDLQVKIRGFRVELGDIESVLHDYFKVNQAVVIYDNILHEDEKILVACIQSIEKDFSSDLRIFCSTKLPPYMIPNHFVYFDKFPLTPNFKIDRKEMIDILKEQFQTILI